MSLARFWWCLAAALILLTWSLAPVLGMETDIWWHLAAGQRWWHYGLEIKDPYSFTHSNQPWIHIDWLFQALAFPLYRWTGIPGLLVAKFLTFSAAAGLLATTLKRTPVPAAPHDPGALATPPQNFSGPQATRPDFQIWILVLLTASIWCESVGLRPATASIFFTTLWVFILERARKGQTKSLWLLPPLTILWFNIHVACLAGCLLLGLYATGHCLDRLRLKARPDLTWLSVLPLCALALFVNPQPWALVFYPIHFMLVKSPWRDVILEVQAPHWNWPGTWQTRLLLALSALGVVKSLRAGQTTPLLVTTVCGYLIFFTYRHQFQLCVSLVPWAYLPNNRLARWLTRAAAFLLSVHALATLVSSRLPLEGLIRRETFSDNLVKMASQGPEGLRLFTDMNGAGFFLWSLAGHQKVFIDSRGDQVYTQASFVSAYFEILLGRPQALELLDRFQVQAVANNRITSADSLLFTQLLPNSPQWKRVYSDMIGEFYVRTELASKFMPVAQPAYLENYLQAIQFQQQGHPEQAIDAVQRSLDDYPQFSSAHQLLAQLWLARGDYARARQELARAELDNPDAPAIDQNWQALGQPMPPWIRRLFLPFWAL